jgi:hypothetical protein
MITTRAVNQPCLISLPWEPYYQGYHLNKHQVNRSPFCLISNAFSFLDIMQNDRDQHNFSQGDFRRQTPTQIFKTKSLKILNVKRISLLIQNFFSAKMRTIKHGGIKKPLRKSSPKRLNFSSLHSRQTIVIDEIKQNELPYDLYHIGTFIKNQSVFRTVSI